MGLGDSQKESRVTLGFLGRVGGSPPWDCGSSLFYLSNLVSDNYWIISPRESSSHPTSQAQPQPPTCKHHQSLAYCSSNISFND